MTMLTPSVLTSVSCSAEKFIKRDRLEGDDGGDITGTGLDLSLILTRNLEVFQKAGTPKISIPATSSKGRGSTGI